MGGLDPFFKSLIQDMLRPRSSVAGRESFGRSRSDMWLCLPGAAGFRGFLSARPVPADCLDCEQVMRCGAFTLLSFSRQANVS